MESTEFENVFTTTIETSEGKIFCRITENDDKEPLTYMVEFTYPDGVIVCELMLFNPETQRLEFEIWSTFYRDDHAVIEEMLCNEIMNRNL